MVVQTRRSGSLGSNFPSEQEQVLEQEQEQLPGHLSGQVPDPQLTVREKGLEKRFEKGFVLSDSARAKVVIMGFVLLLVLELVTKKMGKNPPSYFIGEFTNLVTSFFVEMGDKLFIAFDIIASYCNVKDLAQGFGDLLWLFFKLALAPYRMFEGMAMAISSQGIKDSWHTIVTGFVALAIALTVIEINTSGGFKPSSWIGKASKIVTTTYKYFGRFISDLSSVYRVLKLEKFFDALFTLLWPIYKIVVAPIKSTLNGYFAEVSKHRYGIIIVFGTISLALLAGYGFVPQFLETLEVGSRAPLRRQ